MKKAGKKLFFIFATALLFRLSLFPFFINQPLNIVDEQHYNKLALAILERGEYGWAPGKPTAIRPPLYPAFLAGVYKIFGTENYNAVRLIQIVLALLSGLLVYFLAQKIFRKEKIAFGATAFFLFYPSLVIFNYLILTETLFIFLFLLALYFLMAGIEIVLCGLGMRDCFGAPPLAMTSPFRHCERSEAVSPDRGNERLLRGFAPRNDKKGARLRNDERDEKPRNDASCVMASECKGAKQSRNGKAWIYLLLAGICWGLASLTRSVTYPLTPFIALFLFLVWPRKKQGLLAGIIFIFATMLALSPWIVRNYQVFGHFIAVDTMGGLNLYMGNYEHTPLHRAWAAVDNPPEIAWYRGHEKELAGLNEAEKQRWTIKKALEFMKEHPGLTALRTVIKAANFWQLERTIIAGIQRGIFPGLSNKLLEIGVALSILGAYVLVAIFGFCGLLWRLFSRGEIASALTGLAMTIREKGLAMTEKGEGPRHDNRGEGVRNDASLCHCERSEAVLIAMTPLPVTASEAKQSQVIIRETKIFDYLIILIILYFTAIHAVVFGHSRYHLPLIPLLAMYAAYFLLNIRIFWENQRRRFWQVFIPVCFIFGIFWTYDILIGSKDKVEALLRMLF
ncbi:ArnT family glycosyltransferase [Thermodesulfatator autotrophicus]|uniref:Glycosyltransferase RgtA/B/C/D-like domain-containing protein n=1 Tax=Thermodesulfatator autotrophicus TaxID=1795632 RepID=A0A177E4V5_9BACT|nr:glycosyltransferase family 39 protein [Thermodesulfatator autotrophicus]OAG26997.1 hypothetical protein TH606_09220 [Thermodesulfatator autotrophicus]